MFKLWKQIDGHVVRATTGGELGWSRRPFGLYRCAHRVIGPSGRTDRFVYALPPFHVVLRWLDQCRYWRSWVYDPLIRAGLMDGPEGGYYKEFRFTPKWWKTFERRQERTVIGLRDALSNARADASRWADVAFAEREKINDLKRHFHCADLIAPSWN